MREVPLYRLPKNASVDHAAHVLRQRGRGFRV